MKAVVFKEARKLVVEDVPEPEAGPYEVVVKVKNVGICGSDLHLYSYGFLPPDYIMGHEVTGTIASIGEGVTGWNEGDRVWLSGGGSCGKCDDCLAGNIEACQNHVSIGTGGLPGGYAEYVKVPPTFLLRLPQSVSMREAALLDPLGCAYYPMLLSEIETGQSAVVMGGGPIGLFLVQCLRLLGARPVILSEPVTKRAELGAELGADFVIDPTEANLEEECKKLTDGAGPEMVFECVGIPNTVLESVTLVRKKGKVVWVGVCMEDITFIPAFWVFKQISIQMSFGMGGRDEVKHCLKLIQDRKIEAEKLISETISLEEVPRAFERLLKPNTEVKILMEL